jgi:hypothetical protein
MKKIAVLLLAVVLAGPLLADDKTKPTQSKPAPTTPAPKEKAQEPPPPTFAPSDAQQKDLEIARLKAKLAQATLEGANKAFQSSLDNIGAACTQIIMANKWPSTVKCNLSSLDSPFAFTDTAPPAAAHPDEKK